MASVGMSTATEEDVQEQDDDLEFSSYVVPNPVAAQPKKGPSRVPRGGDDPVSKRRRTMGNLSQAFPEIPEFVPETDMELEKDETPDSVVPTPFMDAPKRTSKAEEKIAKVIKMYNDKKAAFSDEALLEGKLKSRAFSALQKSLEQGANQIVSEPDCADIAKEMLEFPDMVTAKWNLFQKLAKQKLTDVW